eukprot:TRINITY_DN123_c0_g2_i3.p1 TRINITY_DN123_c0_g2~~TRINITY_DN123_c0_g2_i3.p1  ORF type:complete len:759 (+),score=120.51 TRINITY_DN123_c0_g2_i3:550-2826(+)
MGSKLMPHVALWENGSGREARKACAQNVAGVASSARTVTSIACRVVVEKCRLQGRLSWSAKEPLSVFGITRSTARCMPFPKSAEKCSCHRIGRVKCLAEFGASASGLITRGEAIQGPLLDREQEGDELGGGEGLSSGINGPGEGLSYGKFVAEAEEQKMKEEELVPAGGEGDGVWSDSDEGEDEASPVALDAEQETLKLLEWPMICHQLVAFTSTPMGSQRATSGCLPIGTSVLYTQTLLRETEAALLLQHSPSFDGVEDLSAVVQQTQVGKVCEVAELWKVRTTLRAAEALCSSLGVQMNQTAVAGEALVAGRAAVESSLPNSGAEGVRTSSNEGPSAMSLATDNQHPLSPLRAILTGVDLCVELRDNLEHCLDGAMRDVLDRASEELADVRRQRAANQAELEDLLGQSSERLARSGAKDDGTSMVQRRSRLCLGVRAGFKSLLPGGVVLDVSNSGATLFIEPEAAIPLNNREAELAAREKREVQRILGSLSREVAGWGEQLLFLTNQVTSLDLALARAGHARWQHSARPTILPLPSSNGRARTSRTEILSVSQSLPPEDFVKAENLCKPLSSVAQEQPSNPTDDCQESPNSSWKVNVGLVRHPLLLAGALPRPIRQKLQKSGSPLQYDTSSSETRNRQSGEGLAPRSSDQAATATLPVAIDVQVAASVRVVAITGPNTGGKTAALKTLGVAVLMAKAGMYVPAEGSVEFPWFDKVLADIGDEQAVPGAKPVDVQWPCSPSSSHPGSRGLLLARAFG